MAFDRFEIRYSNKLQLSLTKKQLLLVSPIIDLHILFHLIDISFLQYRINIYFRNILILIANYPLFNIFVSIFKIFINISFSFCISIIILLILIYIYNILLAHITYKWSYQWQNSYLFYKFLCIFSFSSISNSNVFNGIHFSISNTMNSFSV